MNTELPANRTRTMIPAMILDTIPSARFACRDSDDEDYVFIRVTRPTYGRFKDCLKVQTQHGEEYRIAFIVYPDGQMYWFNLLAEPALLMAALNPVKYQREYANVIGRCCSCGKELTDPRSRYYGIGPECEKKDDEYVATIDETEGPYEG